MPRKFALNQNELDQLVSDLKSGDSWEQIVKSRLWDLDPKALADSDYKEWAHRQAGIPLEKPKPKKNNDPLD